MDPVSTTFAVVFGIFICGAIVVVCVGCFLSCCCTIEIPAYYIQATDESKVYGKFTRKERIAVIENIFNRLINNRKSQLGIDIEACNDNLQNAEKADSKSKLIDDEICTICLDTFGTTMTTTTATGQAQAQANLTNTVSSSNGKKKKESDDISSNESKFQCQHLNIIQGWRCDHIYHMECIKPWLVEQGKYSCPCCRNDLLNPRYFRRAVLDELKKERVVMLEKWGLDYDSWTKEAN